MRYALWVAACCSLVLPALTEAQAAAGPRITVSSAALSADSVEIGDRFQLALIVELAPGSVAFLPDSLQGPGFQPFDVVSWTERVLDGGGRELSVTYPLIAFQVGTVTVPEFDVFAASASEAVGAGLAVPGSAVGDFEAFVGNVSLVPSARLRTVPAQSLWAASVLILEDQGYQIAPRPPADVLGGNRNWPATLLTLLFGVTLLGVTTVTMRDWMAGRTSRLPAPDPRAAALTGLDQLLATGLHHAGRMKEFYGATSEIARRYVESFDTRWGPSWTSTELMDDLAGRATAPGHRTGGGVATTGVESAAETAGPAPGPVIPPPGPLAEELREAELVKFAGTRPDEDAAEEHARAVRSWIEASVPLEAAGEDGE